MKFFKCGKCDKILENKYAGNQPSSEIIWYDATEHEERIKKVEEIEGKGNEEKLEEEKKKRLESYRADLDDMDQDEMDELISQLKAQIEELRKKLNPDEEDKETKKSKSAMAEFIGVNNYHSAGVDVDTAVESLTTLQNQTHRKKLKYSQSYSVLALKPYESVTHSGDSLLIKMGSTDSDSVSDTSGDELLKSLGSVD